MPKRKKSNSVSLLSTMTLPAVVSITGACVLVLEVVAVRALSPYFGNTIYTFSSVITTVLAALSIGYYVGGRLADRTLRAQLFYGIILLSGIGVLLMVGVIQSLLPLWAYVFPVKTGPLLSSIILFFLPSFLLGLLSPYAVALQAKRTGAGIGSVTGLLFFWSTFGSIAGSLSAGFILIPHVGVHESLLGVAFVLLAVGAVGLSYCKIGTKNAMRLSVIAIASMATYGLLQTQAQANERVMYEVDGLYENIRVVESTWKGKPTRFLLQDRNLSSGMYVNSEELAFSYAEFFRLWPAFTPQPKRILVLGAGAYSLPRAMVDEIHHADVYTVDIEPLLEKIAQEYFRLEPHPRIHTVIADGRRYLHDEEEKFDIIFGDAYSSDHALPSHMATKEFFELVDAKLADNGVFMVNFIGSTEDTHPSLLLSLLHTFSTVFEQTDVFAVQSPTQKDKQNVMVFGYKGQNKKFCNGSAYYGVDNLCSRKIDLSQYNLKQHRLLTDNYAPIEYLASFTL